MRWKRYCFTRLNWPRRRLAIDTVTNEAVGVIYCGRSSAKRIVAPAAVAAALPACCLPRVALDRCEGALEEGVVDDVAFSIFTVDDPLTAIHVAKASIGRDGAGMLTLLGVDK
jgi:hypothetical protein